jgi:hypothetical protein
LLEAGYRAELECITAKVFASEAVKHAAVELALPTHGGRFFLQGHPAGDMLYDYLAPCIYEGENDLLCLAMFHTLAKDSREVRPTLNRSLETPWSLVSSRIKPSTVSNRSLLQAELIAIAREVQTITVLSLLNANQSPAAQRHASELLRLQLQRKLGLECQSTNVELEQEIALGQALLANPPEDLADAPPFVNPLPT